VGQAVFILDLAGARNRILTDLQQRMQYSKWRRRGILHTSATGDSSPMKRHRTDPLSLRKKPQQERSRATIDVIFEATIQILLANGFDKTTTIQIADRAGVSVGSLYQYFPNKRALLAAIVKRHVGEVADITIAACKSAHGKTIQEMCVMTMSAFVDAKTRRPEVSRALYLPAAAVNGEAIVKEEVIRCAQAMHDMLITASDAKFAQPLAVSKVLIASIVGPTQAAIEAGGNRNSFEVLKLHLTALCIGYLKQVSTVAGEHSQPATHSSQQQ
jgi:AcrR family transcriptional regulator